MNVSTSLNVFDAAIPRTEAVRRCAAAGFASLDMNYWDFQKQVLHMSEEEERAWARDIRASADEAGVRFTQMHGPVHGPTFANLVLELTLDAYERLVERSLRTAHILGVPWVVFHPSNLSVDGGESYEQTLEFNVRFYRKFVPILEETGVGIALENMTGHRQARTYFTVPEEQIELIDALDHPLVGACWDTGHGHKMSLNQKEAIAALGSRLKATHIQDNNGTHDQHVLPYQGTIRWDEVAQTLKAIGYEGDFTYETHNSIRTLPDGIRDAGLTYACSLGHYIISL
ncbi:sugar phosphate isomerase/epimerase family protein [Paenibacillus sp. GYB003]|uniref:sugar phosphate isomerase/epimerase family protein n=1 Tax=Paenibacillus sp. GYB003 TaxID=2994392 RepID=UPI002F96159F